MNGKDEILNGFEHHDSNAFNWRLFVTIAWINRWWIVAYMIVMLLIAYLYLRYATPMYESQADVQFIDKSQENTIDLGILVSKPNIDRLNEEMIILKSKGYKINALKKLPINISYFLKERLKSADIYSASPYKVSATVLDSSIIGTEIDFSILNEQSYNIRYNYKGETITTDYTFGKEYNTPAFNIIVQLTDNNPSTWNKRYYFIINDLNEKAEEIEKDIEIDVDNLYGGKIVINYKNPNREKCQEVVNTIAQEIVQLSLERKTQSASKVIEFIEMQIDSLEKELYNQENILKNFKKQNQIISPSIAETSITQKLSEIDQEQLELMLEEKSLKWLSDFANNSTNDIDELSNFFGDLKYNDFSNYINSLTELTKQKENLSISVAPSDPRIVNLTKQIADIKKNFISAITNAQEKLNVRKQYLNTEEAKYEKQFLDLPEKESEFARLTRLNDLKEKYYLLLLEKQSEYEISLAGMASDYVVLDPGERGALVSPVKTRVWGLCFLIGIALSFSHVYMRFLLHSVIIGVPDVEKATVVPILGILPQYTKNKLELPQIVVDKHPRTQIAEAFRSVRSNMQYFLKNKQKGVLLSITSTISGEGKTFIALNLAYVISTLEKKVVLVDFDLRKPKVHKAFNFTNEKGVSTILTGKHTLAECVLHLEHQYLDLVLSGPTPPNPAELLVSSSADALLKSLQEAYDYVIIDSPPVGIVADAIPILSKVDLPMYVVRANYSKRNFINNVNRLYAENGLRNLALVVNDANASGTEYGYGYGSGYGYGYSGYHDYYSDGEHKQSFLQKFLGIKGKIKLF
jgi:capsular exopolysaccharide synthesis family protein